MEYSSVLRDVIKVADEASKRVLHIYQSDFKVSYKDDSSPITAADLASHEEIARGVRNISHDIPILSEEGAGRWLGVAQALASFLVDRSG